VAARPGRRPVARRAPAHRGDAPASGVRRRCSGRSRIRAALVRADHFSDDVQALIALFGQHRVRYLLVGGEAVIYHGHPRLTGGVDFWFDQTTDNASRLFAALREYWEGAVPGLADAAELMAPAVIVQFGRPPHRIDLRPRRCRAPRAGARPNVEEVAVVRHAAISVSIAENGTARTSSVPPCMRAFEEPGGRLVLGGELEDLERSTTLRQPDAARAPARRRASARRPCIACMGLHRPRRSSAPPREQAAASRAPTLVVTPRSGVRRTGRRSWTTRTSASRSATGSRSSPCTGPSPRAPRGVGWGVAAMSDTSRLEIGPSWGLPARCRVQDHALRCRGACRQAIPSAGNPVFDVLQLRRRLDATLVHQHRAIVLIRLERFPGAP